jgi:hypothetical protein
MTFIDRKIRAAIILLLTSLWLPCSAISEQAAANLVLVTLDGVRWQEVFGGIDLKLIEDKRYSRRPELLKTTYWHEERVARRKELFPFFWSVVAAQGVLVGDRNAGSHMEVTNPWWFSYPGYNEILTGRADPDIDSNGRNWNPNTTFLEILNEMEGFKNRVMVFGSWDVFPYIINTQRSALPVNAGFSIATPAATEYVRWLNQVSSEATRLWPTVRLDFITHGYAREAFKTQQPRVVYIAYGETDDFAHDLSYDRYIEAAHRTDQMLQDLWNLLQEDPFYRDRTVLVITTDHGRGNTPDGWPRHSGPKPELPEGVPGSNEIWLAAMGPSIRSTGILKGQWKQSQVAATALASLRLDPTSIMPHAAQAMSQLLK